MGPVPRSADLLPATLRLGRIAGIPLGLHISWLILAGLITLSLAGHFGETHSAWSPATIWSVSALTALLFFATLLAHELSHALVARVHGLPVRSITLFALGGVAHIEKDSSSAKTEFLVAIVGPITSLVIGFGCLAIAQTLGWTFDAGGAGGAGSVLGWLGSINIILAVFNLIPGYPLDGGRVLRAVLWASTRTSIGSGSIVGLVTPHEVRTVDRDRWATSPVKDVMRPLGSLRLVEPGTPAADALKTMAREDVNQLPVVQDGRVEGVVTRSHILHLLQSRNELGRTAA